MADESENLPAVDDVGTGPAGLSYGSGGGSLLQGFYNLNILRQLGLMVGLASSVAIGFWVVLWASGADYRPLYSSLEHIDASKVIEVLEGNKIKYKIDHASGALLVDADQIFTARLRLADAGMQGDKASGFEMLDKDQPLGTSQFMENARYRRSLEGELSRTIRSISSVRNARVHLAVPRASVFIRDARKPSASVFVELFPGTMLKNDQVRAIANLVAASISELTLENVTVVDQKGNLLSKFDEPDEMVAANRQLQYVKKIEDNLVERISRILRPVVGDGRFKAEVSVDVDFTEVEQTEEMFNPDLPAVRSEQTMEEQKVPGAEIGGIPGALSNQPPGVGSAPEEAAGGEETAQSATPPSVRRQATRNFELDRTISHTKHQVGRVRRLSVAVVIDDIEVLDAETGEKSGKSWQANDLERLTILIKDTVGFSAARGDSVNVLNAAFVLKPPEEVELPEPQWYELPIVLQAAKWGGIALGFLMAILLVIRPVLKNLSTAGQDLREMEAQRALAGAEGDLGGQADLSGHGSLLLPSPGESYEQQLNAVKGLIAEDPGRVAQVVKRWVSASE